MHAAWLVGFGIAGTGFGVILAVVGRASTDDNRSMSLAIATAAGSAGQVFGAPVAEWMLTFLSWQSTFIVFAGVILAMILTLPLMRAPAMASKAELEESLGQILVKAFKDPSYTLIFLGFLIVKELLYAPRLSVLPKARWNRLSNISRKENNLARKSLHFKPFGLRLLRWQP